MSVPRIEAFDLADWVIDYASGVQHNLTNSSIKTPLLSEMGIRVDYDEFQRKRHSFRGALKRTIAHTYDVPEDSVLVTCSGSEAIFLVVGSTIQTGDEVIVTTPSYAPTYQVPHLFGARVKYVHSHLEDGFQPDVTKLSEAISSSTKLLVLTNSNNPSGCMINGKMLQEILEIAGDSNVIVDEAFREFGFKNAPPIGAALRENCLSLGTMSKFYGVEDLRIGWIIAKKELIERAGKLKNWVTIENSVFSEMIASIVLEARERFVGRARGFYDENVALVEQWIRTRSELEWVKPNAGLICFPRFNMPISSVELGRQLVEEHGVAIGPGAFFNAEGHFRLCFTRTREEVREALAALGRGLDSILETTVKTN
jgi:aspartate/methionine/tyrosine aminotransferase